MSRIELTITTSKSVDECRSFIDNQVLRRPEAQMLLQEHRWEGDTLHAAGSLGSGTIELRPGEIFVDIELSMFGSAAKSRIEDVLQEQFKKLES